MPANDIPEIDDTEESEDLSSHGEQLVCPIRGTLKARAQRADGLGPSEEKLRIDAIRYLIRKGYPKTHIRPETVVQRLGNGGRNRVRADIVVLDVPVSDLPDHSVETILSHALAIVEVKRDNKNRASAVEHQLLPILRQSARPDCFGLYWDDVDRVYYTKSTTPDGHAEIRQSPFAAVPDYLGKSTSTRLALSDLRAPASVTGLFDRVEDVLHARGVNGTVRYTTILQLLLAKIWDEHAADAGKALVFQDYLSEGMKPEEILKVANGQVKKAVTAYKPHLPVEIGTEFVSQITGQDAGEMLRLLSPVSLMKASHTLIQDFYMQLAKHLIDKKDLAQYFTPPALTDFVVEVMNPGPGEHIKDPACGSADFITSAFRRGTQAGYRDYASFMHGTDLSPAAIQVAVLNMLLNGDGKTNLKVEDALAEIVANEGQSQVVFCNPPFGTKILERRQEVLAKYDLGHRWDKDDEGHFTKTSNVLAKQQTGLLFAELCVRSVEPGGRFALILPNGYLGNVTNDYIIFREWLLRHCRVAAVLAFPAGVFSASGAGVAASVILCERREAPLSSARDTEDYEMAVETIERVGWTLGGKKQKPTYLRDLTSGALLNDAENRPIVDSELPEVISRVRQSGAASHFDWLRLDEMVEDDRACDLGWSVPISNVVNDQHLTLDARRHSKKREQVRRAIKRSSDGYFRLGDVVKIANERASLIPSRRYRYVDITALERGYANPKEYRGWALPDRAQYLAEPGQLFVASIWGSVEKWWLAPDGAKDFVVSNGCHQVQVLDPAYLPDIVAGLCTEAYAIQARAATRGSDGLAVMREEDFGEILLPRLSDEARLAMKPVVKRLREGHTTPVDVVNGLANSRSYRTPRIDPRNSSQGLV